MAELQYDIFGLECDENEMKKQIENEFLFGFGFKKEGIEILEYSSKSEQSGIYEYLMFTYEDKTYTYYWDSKKKDSELHLFEENSAKRFIRIY